MHARRHPRHEAREHGQERAITGCLPGGAAEVAQELVRIEADAHVLDAEGAVAVDERGQERMVDVAARGLPGEHAIPPRDVLDLGRRAGEERPARRDCPVRLRVLRKHLGVSRSGSTVIDDEATFAPKSVPSRLEPGQLGREQRTGVGAGRVDEGDGDDFAAQVGQSEPAAVRGRQRELRRRADRRAAARPRPAGAPSAGSAVREDAGDGKSRDRHAARSLSALQLLLQLVEEAPVGARRR